MGVSNHLLTGMILQVFPPYPYINLEFYILVPPIIMGAERGCVLKGAPIGTHVLHFHYGRKGEMYKVQGSLYYQPKQCIVFREIPQNYPAFVLFDSPKMGPIQKPLKIS